MADRLNMYRKSSLDCSLYHIGIRMLLLLIKTQRLSAANKRPYFFPPSLVRMMVGEKLFADRPLEVQYRFGQIRQFPFVPRRELLGVLMFPSSEKKSHVVHSLGLPLCAVHTYGFTCVIRCHRFAFSPDILTDISLAISSQGGRFPRQLKSVVLSAGIEEFKYAIGNFGSQAYPEGLINDKKYNRVPKEPYLGLAGV